MAEDAGVSVDILKLKVPDLKKELKMRGLSTSGNKNDLLERLKTVLKSTDVVGSESVEDLDEDLLNDDDDEHIDSESAILETELDESPQAPKRKLEDDTNNVEPKRGAPKKIVLNRNNSGSAEVVKPIENESTDTTKAVNTNEEKKVIKLSQLSAKERLEMRAKKFGVTALSSDAKRVVRAERFGVKDNSATSITSTTVVTSVDVLKQRAERFGGSVSTVMSSLENREKLEKRKARFGNTTTANGPTLVESEKTKLRLERFKQPVV